MRLGDIARKLNCELQGNPDTEILRITGIDEATIGDLTFVSNPRYLPKLKVTRASAVIVAEDSPPLTHQTLRTDNPYLAFARAIELFYSAPTRPSGIHSTAVIAPSAQIGSNPSIGPFVVIDDEVSVGDNAVLHPHVTIYRGVRIGNDFLAHSHVTVREYCEIGNNVILQNGVVIGADGFGFAKKGDQSYYKILQSGRVVLEDDVEVQANSTVDRSAIGETRIQRGAKIDNLVQVGHGSRVGKNTLLCAQVGLAGTTDVGNNVILTGQVGVAGHCKVGDGVVATAQTGIPSDVDPGKIISGYPAIDNRLWLKCSVLFMKLPEFNRLLKELNSKVHELISRSSK
jgi:UDP-3-O-[3-hydroxymyristoyl] glucosamine N-acyltransferase